MAGDGQMDPDYLVDLLDPIVDGQCDVAKANRFYSSTSFRGMPRNRVAGNIVLSFLNKLASGYWHIVDPQNGYVALSREALEAIPFDSIAKGYSLENDMLINLNMIEARVADVPVPARYADEESGIKLRRVVPQMMRLLFVGFFRRIIWKYVLWSFSPIALFLFTGMALLLFGAVVGAWTLTQTLGEPVASTGTVLLSVAPLLAGINLVLSGLMLDIHEGRRLEVHIGRFGGRTTRRSVQRRARALGDSPSLGDARDDPPHASATSHRRSLSSR
jgi:hypothetical protein